MSKNKIITYLHMYFHHQREALHCEDVVKHDRLKRRR